MFFTAAAVPGQKIPANCTISASIADLLGAAGTSLTLNNMEILQDRQTLFAIADMARSPPKIYFGSDISDADVTRYNENEKCVTEAGSNLDKTKDFVPTPDCTGTPYPPPDTSTKTN